MKLSALAAQIKSCGHCEVINNGGRIFVGTGSAFYCMDGYPRTQDAGELGAMLGIPQKKMKNIFYHEEYTMDGKLYGVRWDDEPEHEGTTSEIKTRIVINGEELIALRNPNRLKIGRKNNGCCRKRCPFAGQKGAESRKPEFSDVP